MPRLRLSFLGHFQVTLEGENVDAFGTDKVRALLVYLAVEADRPHRRSFLAGLFWADQPEKKALHSLRQALSTLRKALPEGQDDPPFLLVTRETVQFNSASPHWLDVKAFSEHFKLAIRHYRRQSFAGRLQIRHLAQAIDLYQGCFLDEFFVSDSAAFEEWATLQREALNRQAMEALSLLLEYYERRQEYHLARHAAAHLLELAPWEEAIHRQLMRLLAQDGQWSAAQAQYHTCRRYLTAELGVDPTPETIALFEEIRRRAAADSPLPTRYPAAPHNLPAASTPFVGRESELDELADMLADPHCRLVTLFGPGGIGKTRLALEAAGEQIGVFPDGVYFVSLGPVSTGDGIAAAIAEAIDFVFSDGDDPNTQILNYLGGKKMLLVLDNLEHLLDSVDLITDIIKDAPGVLLMVTSRERLSLQEEWLYTVQGLSYPERVDEPGDGLENYSAVSLFLRYARRLKHDYTLSGVERGGLIRVCQLVEGIPLGVELAASALWTHSCQEVATEIAHNLDFLETQARNVPDRHRSLRATFEYSWESLTPAERDIYARLSIFRGGFRREAAAQVAGASASVLTALLDKSLLRLDDPGRYDMHGLLRQYAEEKLCADVQACENTKARHARYFAGFLQEQETLLQGDQRKLALMAIAPELENARLAWELAVARGWADLVGACAYSLYSIYNNRSRYQEGIDLLQQAITGWEEDELQQALLAKVLDYQGALYHRLGAYEKTMKCLEQSLKIAKRLDMPEVQVSCLLRLSDVTCRLGDSDRSWPLAQEGLDLSRALDDERSISRALYLLGFIGNRGGEIVRSRELLEESLVFARKCGDPHTLIPPLNVLGDIACHQGDYAQARHVFEECLALSRDLGNQFGVAMHLNNLGTVLHVLEDYEGARSFYQESLEICQKIGDQEGQAIALSNLGEIAHVLGAYSEAQAFYKQGLSIGRAIQDQWTIMSCLNNLGGTACALQDDQTARDYLAEALEITARTQTLPVMMKVLVNLALLFGRNEQTNRAAELLGLVLKHPASDQDTREKAERLSAEMDLSALDEPSRPLEEVMDDLFAELSFTYRPGSSNCQRH